jgi:3-oxoacyl-[acyl-carrier-protein] synthase II
MGGKGEFMSEKQRVVITGLGLISPVGNEVSTAWQNILAGKSGVGPINTFDVSAYTTRIAALIKDFDPNLFGLSSKDSKKMDPFVQYGVAAAIKALADAGLTPHPNNPTRYGVSIGSGIGGLEFIERNHHSMLNAGPRRVSPFFIPGAIINMISGYVSIHYGYQGPNLAFATACTTGCHSIGMAARTISYGDADVMVAGGAEKASTPLGLAGFASARALSMNNEAPEQASRPFDQNRDGFVLGDGAGVVVLESYAHAKKRGAPIYAELVGFGMSGDAHHITQPSHGGVGAAHCMQSALNDAKCSPSDISYINAHGTSTKMNDLTETLAIKLAFAEHAQQLAVSSTKSMTGHLLGAAGAIEAIFCVLALRDQVIPPTINFQTPDPECDLDYVPNEPRALQFKRCMSNSFGFGGTNGALIFSQL